MRIATRAGRVTAQISLLLALVSTSGYMVTRTYLDDPEQVYKDGAITDVVKAPRGGSWDGGIWTRCRRTRDWSTTKARRSTRWDRPVR